MSSLFNSTLLVYWDNILVGLAQDLHNTVDAGYKNIVGNCIHVLITGISDTMDIAYKNTLGSRKYISIAYIHYVCVYENRFQMMLLISSKFL